MLPDRGQKLQKCIRQQKEEMEMLTRELENTPLEPLSSDRETKTIEKLHLMNEEIPCFKDESDSDYSPSDHSDYSYLDINNIPMKPTTSPELNELGKKAQATRDKELALTVERLQDLHESLIARPLEREKIEDPRGLKVQLMRPTESNKRN